MPTDPTNLFSDDEGFDPRVRADRELAAALVRALDPLAPPAASWERIVQNIAAGPVSTGPRLASGSGTFAARPPIRRGTSPWVWGLVTAAAAGLGVVVGTFFAARPVGPDAQLALLQQQLTERDREVAALEAEAQGMEAELRSLESVLSAEQIRFAQLLPNEGDVGPARARAFFDAAAGQWRFRITNLPRISADRVFQLWFVTEDKGILGSEAFDVTADGTARFAVAPPPDAKLVAFAISDEPPGGVPVRTGEIRLIGGIQTATPQP